eukprot:4933614-Heterocapsa_arctica.AAC.1
MGFALITGLQDHRPDSLESSPGKWNAGRHEGICKRKENIRSYDERIREYFFQSNTKHSLAQNTGKRAPKRSKLVAHRQHGEGEGKDERGKGKNEKLRFNKQERAGEDAQQEQ